MTNTFASLSPREQDAALAELAGLEVLPFTTSLDAMRLVERVIEERGKTKDYLRILLSMMSDRSWHVQGGWWDMHSASLCALFQAPALLRAEAAWRVLGAKEDA